MSITAVALVLLSAFMHASWNFIGKKNRPSASSFAVITCFGSLCVAPFLLLLSDGLNALNTEIILLLMASCFCQALYFYSLGQGYRNGDMSVIYPVSRSLPVLMVALGVTVFGQGSELQEGDWIAFSLIFSGCLILPLDKFSLASVRRYLNIAVLFAILAVVGTTGYSILDDRALRLLRMSWDISGVSYKAAFLYLILQTIGSAVLLLLVTLPFREQREEMTVLCKHHFVSLLLAGIAVFATYCIVLAAMAFSENVSYVVALRQASIPIGILIGVCLLKEEATLTKWLGTLMLVTGLVWVSL